MRRLAESFLPTTGEPPAVNQVEWHPFNFKPALLSYCEEKGIALESWGPLTRGEKLGDPTVVGIAHRHGRTPAQVLLRWQLQHGVITIPKSATPSRIRENAALYDFALTEDEMAQLDGLGCGFSTSSWLPCPPRSGTDPH